MASTYTPLGVELQATGENAGTWGTKTNTNLQIIEQISGGFIQQSIAGGAQTTTLSVSDGSTGAALSHRMIEFTGTITGNQIVTIPLDVQTFYFLRNSTSGAYTVQFKYVSGSGDSFTFSATNKGDAVIFAAADDGTNPNIVTINTGIKSVVEDTTPQLGGNLDTNSHNVDIDDAHGIRDENGNEQIIFQTTASAVNQFDITNAATGNAPALSATGGDTNIDMNLTPKGYGRATFNGQGKIQSVAEKVTTEATAATGTVNYDVLTQAVWNFTSDASGNWTLNIRGDGSNSLNNIMDTGESITISHIVKQGSSAYYNSAVQVDGSSVTPEWQGGSAPSAGNASSLDVYGYTVIKTGDAAFTVLAAQTQFA
jgi:hypothetical protein